MVQPRMTLATRRVLEALLAVEERYGGDIGSAAGLPSGTVHPILARLEGLDWVASRWEDVDPRAAGRPARRYYRLTAEGRSLASAALARVAARAPRGVPGLSS
jgi:PadR family transcriptional regulator, regulatory protein PadR